MRRIISAIGKWIHARCWKDSSNSVEYWEYIEHVKPNPKKYYPPYEQRDRWY